MAVGRGRAGDPKPILIVVLILRRKKMRAASKGVKQRTAVINAEIESSLSGIRTAKALRQRDVEFKKIRHQRQRALQGLQARVLSSDGHLQRLAGILPAAAVRGGRGLWRLPIMQGRMEMVDLLTFSLIYLDLHQPRARVFSSTLPRCSRFWLWLGLERFTELMRTEPQCPGTPDAK